MQKLCCLPSRKIASHSNLRSLGYLKNLKINKSTSTIKYSTAMDTIDSKFLPTAQTKLLHIFNTGLAAVMPATLIEKKVTVEDDYLVVEGVKYPITENVYIVGFGKAVAGMANVMEKLLGPRLKQGIISIPYHSKIFFGAGITTSIVQCHEGAENNQPDANSVSCTELIVELAKSLKKGDTLITLISGGGSALLSSPRPPITLESKKNLCRILQNAGANITELNHVRKVLSRVKGGGLARIAYPARVLTLILSDVVGDSMESIASGPTCPFGTGVDKPEKTAIRILKKYKIYTELEDDMKQLFDDSNIQSEEKTMVDKNGKFKHVSNILIGNNNTALQAAEAVTKGLDLESLILTSAAEGDIADVSYAYAKWTTLACHVVENKFCAKEDFIAAVKNDNVLDVLKISVETLGKGFDILSNVRKDGGIVFLSGGEPSVVVKGSGIGGRNQELALRFSIDWLGEIAKEPSLAKYFVLFFSAGTDGQDGPTDAAGAFGYPGIRPKIMNNLKKVLKMKKTTGNAAKLKEIEEEIQRLENMLPENVLKENNSYNFYSTFENGSNLVKIGLTGTNVMDLHFIYIKKRDCQCTV